MASQETFNTLVGHMKQFKSSVPNQQKPVLWLGAGCSVFDGVPASSDLMNAVLLNEPPSWGSLQFRFDEFLDHFGQGSARAQLLYKYFALKIKPDSPYHALVRLLAAGYFDLVFTFNIDDLLEQAFAKAGLREGDGPSCDYSLIKVPVLRPEVPELQVEMAGTPRVKVVKLHGDFNLGLNYMTSSEIVAYERRIAGFVSKYSERPALVCGYSFFHLNVLQAFSLTGGSFFYVNRSFPDAPMVLSLMKSRSKQRPLFIDQPLGIFDRFVAALVTSVPLT